MSVLFGNPFNPQHPAGAGGSVNPALIDHNQLMNLTVGDVHTQYTYHAGRSGGQTIYGGDGSSDDLNLRSTSDSTKGIVNIAEDLIYIDENNNRVGVNTTSTSDNVQGSNNGSQLKIEHTASPTFALHIQRNIDSSSAGIFLASKSRGTDVSPTAVQDGDQLFQINFAGYDGTTYKYSSRIAARVDGAVSSGVVGGDLLFQTADSSGNLQTAITLDVNQTATFSGSTSGIDHTELDNIGTNTHAQIDSHIANTSNPHSVTAAQVGNTVAQWNASEIQGITVTGASPTNGQILSYDSGSGEFVYTSSPVDESTIDHNALMNLTTGDVHTQYMYLLGRTGGQVLAGGDSSGDTLKLESTSNATKGSTEIGSAGFYLDETTNRVGINTTSTSDSVQGSSNGSKFKVAHENSTTFAGQFQRNVSSSAAGQLLLTRGRGTNASPAALQDNDLIFNIDFAGHDGTSYRYSSRIVSRVDGAVSTGIVAGDLLFQTANTSGTLSTAITIDNAQQVTFGGSTSGIDHTELTNIGTNTHAQIDSHIANTSNPHSVTASQVGNTVAQWNANQIQGVDVAGTSPSDGQVLEYNSGNSRYEPTTPGGGASSATPSSEGLVYGLTETSTFSNTILGYDTTDSGDSNVFVGFRAGKFSISTGGDNVLIGYEAHYNNSDIDGAIIIGEGTNGEDNGIVQIGHASNVGVAQSAIQAINIGENADCNSDYSINIGAGTDTNGAGSGQYALTMGINCNNTGSDNVALGRQITTVNDHAIGLGGFANTTAANEFQIGSDSGTGSGRIFRFRSPNLDGHASSTAMTYNTSTGEINYQTSSRRYKENERALGYTKETILNLTPVRFDQKFREALRYTEADRTNDVAKIISRKSNQDMKAEQQYNKKINNIIAKTDEKLSKAKTQEEVTEIENNKVRMEQKALDKYNHQLAINEENKNKSIDTCDNKLEVSNQEETKRKNQIGLIAEDVAPIIPEIVSYSKDKDGNLRPESIEYNKLSVLNLEVIKEQQTKIDELESRLAVLEAA